MDWYVMQCKPKKEQFLHNQLCAHGIETFFPCIEPVTASRNRGKKKPYFPGYLFIRVDLENTGDSILKWMPGSIGLVQFGGESAIVPAAVIDGIKRKLEIMKSPEDKSLKFKVGDEVIIHSEIFNKYRGIFDGYSSGRKRVQVFLKMLNDRQVRMELSIDEVEPGSIH